MGTPTSLLAFKEALSGWRTIDGDDICPDCWPRWLMQFEEPYRTEVQESSRPTAQYVRSRKSADGWFVMCEKGCSVNSVFLPYGSSSPN